MACVCVACVCVCVACVCMCVCGQSSVSRAAGAHVWHVCVACVRMCAGAIWHMKCCLNKQQEPQGPPDSVIPSVKKLVT